MKKQYFLYLICLLVIFVSCDKKEDQPIAKPPVVTKPTLYYYPPVMRIVTDGMVPVASKDDYVKATIIIEERDSSGVVTKKIFEATTEIKGRGNSTWDMPKKPYRLKLTDKAAILGMPSNKHWVLLANYSDKTLMRNTLAFEISRRMGFPYTPRMHYVDLYVNGSFEGNYMFGDHVRTGSDRIDIPELKPADTNITGGYHLEIDERRGEPHYFETQRAGMIFCIKSPEDIPTNQFTYIRNHVQKVEDILYGIDGINTVEELPKYIDMKSFIDYYLLNELAKNVDGNLRLSTFVYKKRDDDKLYFGPVWDYDLSFGNANYDDGDATARWLARKAAWYGQFFSHPQFDKMVKDRWKQLRVGELANINTFIDQTSEMLTKSQTSNFVRWKILNEYVWPNPQIAGSYKGEVSYLKNWLSERIKWMNSELK